MSNDLLIGFCMGYVIAVILYTIALYKMERKKNTKNSQSLNTKDDE